MKIKYVTIHCSATPDGRNVAPATVDKWGHDRFGQSSYHYIIALDGSFMAPLKHTQVGAHVGKRNTGNIGICYVGGMNRDFTKAKDTRTKEQKETMRTIVRTLIDKYNPIVLGHRDWPDVRKDCPSFDVQQWLDAGMPID